VLLEINLLMELLLDCGWSQVKKKNEIRKEKGGKKKREEKTRK
jgi:hypothetical protein